MKESEPTYYALEDAYNKLIDQGLKDFQAIEELIKTFGAREVSEYINNKERE